jgi:excisionase family DNA binding protein
MTLLTVPEVADRLRLRPARVYEIARKGVLPVVRLGRQVRISEHALQAWLDAGGSGLSSAGTDR